MSVCVCRYVVVMADSSSSIILKSSYCDCIVVLGSE